jgi:hypothetical protein
MSEEKRNLSRRSFFKGAAAAGIAAAVSGGGLLVKELKAAECKLKRGGLKEPPKVKEDKDIVPMGNSLFKASLEGAYDAFNDALDALGKSKEKTVNTAALLAKQGLKLKSPEAKAAGKSVKIPASLLKAREQKGRQKGFHGHASGCVCCCCVHAHISW